jgi:hypothetical protein
MVVGLDLFTEHFKSHTKQYVLIGGSACARHFEQKGIDFRKTKDLDIILIVDALTKEFINHFWEFIKNGEYAIAEKGTKKLFYRFIEPKANGYPYMIELFSRKPDSISIPKGFYLTDIPTDEEISSLSAILLDDDYYDFTLKNTIVSDGLHHANDIALIALKAKAFLNNLKRKNEGQVVRSDDIDKHRRDVIRLILTLNPQLKIDVPDTVKTDLRQYIQTVRKEPPDIRYLLKNLGAGESTLETIFDQLTQSFQLG